MKPPAKPVDVISKTECASGTVVTLMVLDRHLLQPFETFVENDSGVDDASFERFATKPAALAHHRKLVVAAIVAEMMERANARDQK